MKRTNANPYALIFLALFVVMINGCKKEDPAPVVVPKLGENYQGDIIFQLDATGMHGLIAAPADQSTTDAWWNGSVVVTGATSITDGGTNTSMIIQAQGINGTYAANLCTNYRGGGYDDWFLPAKDQLNALYSQKTLVGGFVDNIYWSSTEYNVGDIWVQNFGTGEQHLDGSSDAANVHTRAIRAF